MHTCTHNQSIIKHTGHYRLHECLLACYWDDTTEWVVPPVYIASRSRPASSRRTANEAHMIFCLPKQTACNNNTPSSFSATPTSDGHRRRPRRNTITTQHRRSVQGHAQDRRACFSRQVTHTHTHAHNVITPTHVYSLMCCMHTPATQALAAYPLHVANAPTAPTAPHRQPVCLAL